MFMQCLILEHWFVEQKNQNVANAQCTQTYVQVSKDKFSKFYLKRYSLRRTHGKNSKMGLILISFESGFLFNLFDFSLKENSLLNLYSISKGGDVEFTSYTASLLKNAECFFYNLNILSQKRESHTYFHIDHIAGLTYFLNNFPFLT